MSTIQLRNTYLHSVEKASRLVKFTDNIKTVGIYIHKTDTNA